MNALSNERIRSNFIRAGIRAMVLEDPGSFRRLTVRFHNNQYSAGTQTCFQMPRFGFGMPKPISYRRYRPRSLGRQPPAQFS